MAVPKGFSVKATVAELMVSPERDQSYRFWMPWNCSVWIRSLRDGTRRRACVGLICGYKAVVWAWRAPPQATCLFVFIGTGAAVTFSSVNGPE